MVTIKPTATKTTATKTTATTSTPMTQIEKMQAGRKPVDPNESKEAKFVRLANRRVIKVLKALEQIGALGGPGYNSSEVYRKKITDTLTEALEKNLDRLNKTKVQKVDFRL